jgi:chaperonin cofactor prefoldin
MIIYPSNKDLYFALESHKSAIKDLQKKIEKLEKKVKELNDK